ncbi:MAG: SsrA-binding protein SmpB [Planctomycetota bacterium]
MTSKKKKTAEADPNEKVVCRNRKALFQYNILETVEAGIVLTGTEVKSLRAGKASLDEAYARMEGNELWLLKAEIPEYEMGNRMNHEPKRKRKLLLHRREIAKFAEGKSEQGFTMIPLKIYFRRGRAKVEIAVARGKKIHDKRETMKAKDAKREMARAMQSRRRG